MSFFAFSLNPKKKTTAAETQRQKMAASFHQRVVVGSDDQSLGDADADAAAAGVGRRQETPRKPGRDLSRPYQDKTREVNIFLKSKATKEARKMAPITFFFSCI